MKIKALLLIMLLALCAVPALAQDAGSNSVSFNGFSFSFPTSLASGVNIVQVAGEDTTLEQPGGPTVKHTEFIFHNGDLSAEAGFYGEGILSVFNTADFAGYAQASTEYTNLQTLLTTRPDLSQYMVADAGTNANNLPYLPVIGAAQVLRGQAQYIDTPVLQGVRYLTIFRQDVSPFTGNEFRYVFQGLSNDGAFYVSLVFYLDTTLFPSEIPADFDYDALNQDFTSYLSESIITLNSATTDDFTPSLAALDAVVQTFSFGNTLPEVSAPTVPSASPTVAPTATVGDPLMGGLAGVTWTLTSYGDPANPTPVLEGVPVTLVFSEGGVSGSAGCNSYSAGFQFDNTSLTVNQAIRTLMACEEAIMAQEDSYLNALATVMSYQINGGELQIAYPEGVLNFTAS